MNRRPKKSHPTTTPPAGESARRTSRTAGPAPSTILIVGGDPEFRAELTGLLQTRRHACSHVNRLDEARCAIGGQRHDLVVLNPDLPDGDGFDLVQQIHDMAVSTKTMVFSDTDSFGIALRALRSGAIDFVRTPANIDEIVERIDVALVKSHTEKAREDRIRRVHRICRELNSARDEISQQVDVMCNDLMHAYRDLSDQISDAAMASEFRTLLRQELDMEEVLRTTLEYLLTKTGPTNAAVFLPDADQHYSLGAYVNFDCDRESIDRLLDHLGETICPQMSDELELVAFDDGGEFAEWIGMDSALLVDSQFLAFSCHDAEECLAVVILFRSRSNAYDPELAGTLDILRTIFAEQLARIVRVHHRSGPEWPRETEADDELDDFGYGFGGIAA